METFLARAVTACQRPFLALVLVFGLGCRTEHRAPPRVREGVLDLRGYDLDREPAVRLDGDWSFYWARLLGPEAFHGPAEPAADGFQALPGNWNGRRLAGRALDGRGFATLRLRILAAPARSPMALHLLGLDPAFRLWVDGRLAAEGGGLGPDGSQRGADFSQHLVPLRVDGRPLELVLQVANQTLRLVTLRPIALGRQPDLAQAQARQWGLATSVVGLLLFMGLYHLVLYGLRRHDPAPLCFGCYCLFWAGNMLCVETGGWALRAFWPEVSGVFLYRTYQFCFFLVNPLSYQFLRALFRQEFPRWMLRAWWGVALPCALLALAGPVPLVSAILPWFDLLVAAKLVFFVFALASATARRREGAAIILAGYAVEGLIGCNDMLNSLGVIHTGLLMPAGLAALMLAQVLVLSRRYSRLFSAVEDLSSELARQNLSLEEERSERDRLEQELLSVGEEERRRISHELHDGLCQQLTGARLQCYALASLETGDSRKLETLGKLSSLLEASVAQAYDLSHGLWPAEPAPEDAITALAELVQRMSAASGIPIHYQLQGSRGACGHAQAGQLYRIAQEAIANAVKHAKPSRISVVLDCQGPGGITLTVADDGVGLRKAGKTRGGLGLKMMAHRARVAGGEFRLEGREGGGTRVVCTVPGAAA
jgi:signal transduction histidine kinase